MMTNVDTAEQWKRHVLECGICRNAQSPLDVCPMGRQLWAMSPRPQPVPVYQPAPQPVYNVSSAPPSPSQQMPSAPRPAPVLPIKSSQPKGPPVAESVAISIPANMPDAKFISAIAERVANKVVARTRSGAAIAVPMEKTSKEVSFSTGPGVVLNMPERDIEIYTEMKQAVGALARLGELVGKTIMVCEETKRESKSSEVELDEEQTALIISQVGRHFGASSQEQLYEAFAQVAQQVLRLGDRLGNFMKVDDETRKVIRSTRTLAIEMESELERSYGGRLPLDTDMRRIVRMARMVAMDLQGEIERRVGTP